MSTDNQPPPGAGGPPADPPTGSSFDGFFDTVRKAGIDRSTDRWIGGVAGGVAQRLGIDPLVVRAALLVSLFITGAGIVLYGLAWALLPEKKDGRIHLQQALRGDFDAALLGAGAMVLVGLGWSGWGGWGGRAGFGWILGLFWIALVGGIIYAVVRHSSRMEGDGPSSRPSNNPPNGPGAPGTPGDPGRPGGPGAPGGPGNAPGGSGGAPAAPWGSPSERFPATAQEQAAARTRAYGSGIAADAPVSEPEPPVTPPPAKAPNEPRGPGATTVALVVGISLLTAALILLLGRRADLALSGPLLWTAVTLGLLGLGIVVAGFRGRTGGSLTGFAVLLVLVALPLTALQSVTPAQDGEWVVSGTRQVRTVADAERGLAIGTGNPTIDLSSLRLAGRSTPVHVPLQLGAGNLTVVVPADIPVQADIRVGAGDVRWYVDETEQRISGISTQSHTFTSDEVAAGDDPVLVLEIDAGTGQVTIEEAP